jgi:hypothetical protein
VKVVVFEQEEIDDPSKFSFPDFPTLSTNVSNTTGVYSFSTPMFLDLMVPIDLVWLSSTTPELTAVTGISTASVNTSTVSFSFTRQLVQTFQIYVKIKKHTKPYIAFSGPITITVGCEDDAISLGF